MISSIMALGTMLAERGGDARRLRFAQWFDDHRIAFAASADPDAAANELLDADSDGVEGPVDPYRGDEEPEAILVSWYDKRSPLSSEGGEVLRLPCTDDSYQLTEPSIRALRSTAVQARSIEGKAVVMIAGLAS